MNGIFEVSHFKGLNAVPTIFSARFDVFVPTFKIAAAGAAAIPPTAVTTAFFARSNNCAPFSGRVAV